MEGRPCRTPRKANVCTCSTPAPESSRNRRAARTFVAFHACRVGPPAAPGRCRVLGNKFCTRANPSVGTNCTHPVRHDTGLHFGCIIYIMGGGQLKPSTLICWQQCYPKLTDIQIILRCRLPRLIAACGDSIGPEHKDCGTSAGVGGRAQVGPRQTSDSAGLIHPTHFHVAETKIKASRVIDRTPRLIMVQTVWHMSTVSIRAFGIHLVSLGMGMVMTQYI